MSEVRDLVRALHEAGAPLLVGTDAPNPFVVPGFAVHQELEQLVAAGLSEFDALAAATSKAAEFLGRADTGTLAAGHTADLVLLDRNPLEDIRATRAIAGVLQPIRDEFAELKQENSDQHEANAQLMRDFRDDFDQKWDAHGKLHQKLAEDIGILRGGQDAIMKGAAKLPQWNAVDEEREAG